MHQLDQSIITEFNRQYYDSNVWGWTYWLGYPTAKTPTDLWMYQEIIVAQRPDFIIETGTLFGGSALFMACVCDFTDHGRVISIDIEHRETLPIHSRITYLLGDSTDAWLLKQVQKQIPVGSRCMVVLDSDHSRDHVILELLAYSSFVQPDGYLIVEDTNLNGHPAYPTFGPGPMEAVWEFLESHSEFEIDKEREKFGLTFNPGGFLHRIK